MIASQLSEGAGLVARSTLNRGIFPGEERTHCDLKKWWFRFQADAARINIPLRVVWGYRTWEQQQELHAKGVGAPPGKSAHNFGMALDIIHMRRAWEHMPPEGWRILGAIGQEAARKQGLDIQWGLFRKNGVHWDQAHWQIKDWRSKVPKPCQGVCVGGCTPYYAVDLPKVGAASPVQSLGDARTYPGKGPFAAINWDRVKRILRL